ncbi:DUF5926 family protein [Demetria terragena]|uniref:DUF5926 family protein n=1 Tax=Demetria terragena TaxID=63959 RepID=UPI000477C6B9|nr:DUF5926 family protein [Demetria terragena]
MGKASRRKKAPKDPSAMPPPYARRPFEGLPGETEWVAMREIVPAATARVSYQIDGLKGEATIATVLPLAWPAMHRDNGDLFVALQAGGTSGDVSRDIAVALVAAASTEPGQPLERTPAATASSPRLQDLLDTDTPLKADVHDGFDFWVGEAELDANSAESLSRANEAAAPTVRLDHGGSAFWCQIGDRCYVRWVLPQDDDAATNALARLSAAGRGGLGDGRLLGAFRACGLLVPVWEVDAQAEAAAWNDPMADLVSRFDDAFAEDTPLTAQERSARNGFVSRQITLR